MERHRQWWVIQEKLTPSVQAIRREIFCLAQTAPDLETMHWYMWLDECFENDEVQLDAVETIKWRCWTLSRRELHRVNRLLHMITPIFEAHGQFRKDGG